jgi:hypothetical protein
MSKAKADKVYWLDRSENVTKLFLGLCAVGRSVRTVVWLLCSLRILCVRRAGAHGQGDAARAQASRGLL